MKALAARLLSSRAFIVVAVTLAVVLLLPTLRVGFMMDDDAHGIVVSWIANRNAVLAAAFGFGALLLHDRAVRESDRRARIAAPVLFAVALLAGEAALATLGYLAAHAVWMQKDRWTARLRT